MNETVVNASGYVHYKGNKENLCASVQILFEQNLEYTDLFVKKNQFCALSYMCLYYS